MHPRLQGFPTRNTYPYLVIDPADDPEAANLVAQYAPEPNRLPLAVCPNGRILQNPSEAELAQALGMIPINDKNLPALGPQVSQPLVIVLDRLASWLRSMQPCLAPIHSGRCPVNRLVEFDNHHGKRRHLGEHGSMRCSASVATVGAELTCGDDPIF
jgi:hypothetical protein